MSEVIFDIVDLSVDPTGVGSTTAVTVTLGDSSAGGTGSGAVDSVNGHTGVVVLTASDVGAQPADTDLSAIAALTTTPFGRSLLTAADATAARVLTGAGTSSLALGTTSTTAKAGDYQPTAANISDATTVGRAVLTGATAAAIRATIGAGTSSFDGAYASLTGKPTLGTAAAAATTDFDAAGAAAAAQAASQPLDSDLTAIAALATATFGRSLLTAADAAATRTLIGAGTSSLAIGTTSTTAKAGDYQPASANISDASTIGKTILTAADAAAVRTAIATAPLASPTFTGTPAAPTATAGTNTTQLATTAFVTSAVAAGGGGGGASTDPHPFIF